MDNNRIVVILLGSMALTSFLLLLVVIFLSNKEKNSIIENKNFSTKKTIITSIPKKITPSVSPTLPLPSDLPKPTFTGAVNEDISDTEIKKTEEMRKLRNSLPVETDYFTISFDWGEFKYIVKFKQSEEESYKKFKQWHQNNYPNIPEKEFIFKK